MQIRRATIKDIPIITEHNILLAQESEGESLNPTIVKLGVKSLFSHPEKGFYLVAEKENSIIGQLMITFEWSDWRNTDIWWIQSVYISKQYRKKGVFTALFDEIKKQATKEHIPLLRLYVHKENTSAQQVYEKLDMIKGTYIFYEIGLENHK
jgi:ribosomal protein S18 acetylase RimI-like enzyme